MVSYTAFYTFIHWGLTDCGTRTTLLPAERRAYTDAVLCLMKKPSRLAEIDPTLAPGAKTR